MSGAVGFFSVQIIVDRIRHCSQCGMPSPPLDHDKNTQCCGSPTCTASENDMFLIGPWGRRYCCEGMVRRCVGQGKIELKTLTGAFFKALDLDTPATEELPDLEQGTTEEADDTGHEENGEEEEEDVEAGSLEERKARRQRAREIRKVKKKFERGKIGIEEYHSGLRALGAMQ